MTLTWAQIGDLTGPTGPTPTAEDIAGAVHELVPGHAIGLDPDDEAMTVEVSGLGVPLLDSQYTGTSLTSSVALTTLLDADTTLTADSFLEGDDLCAEAWGILTNNTGSNRTVRFVIDLSGGTLVDVTTGNLTTSALPRAWRLTYRGKVSDADSSGVLIHSGTLEGTAPTITASAAADTAWDFKFGSSTATIDWTSDLALDLQAQLSFSSSSLSVQMYGWSVWRAVAP